MRKRKRVKCRFWAGERRQHASLFLFERTIILVPPQISRGGKCHLEHCLFALLRPNDLQFRKALLVRRFPPRPDACRARRMPLPGLLEESSGGTATVTGPARYASRSSFGDQ